MDRFVVSTDDEEIGAISEEHGAEVLWRPAELASDHATSLSVWQHALSAIPADILVNLYPTSPIRDEGMIDEAIVRFLRTRPTGLATGFRCKYVPFGTADDGLTNLLGRQQIEGFFYDDGNIYVVESRTILKGLQYGERLEHFYVSRECNIEVDDEFDLWLAEQVLLRRMSRMKTG